MCEICLRDGDQLNFIRNVFDDCKELNLEYTTRLTVFQKIKLERAAHFHFGPCFKTGYDKK